MQIERANQEVKQREAEVVKKLAEAQATLEDAAQREAGARRATAELQRLDKQLSARKLDAKELQVPTHYSQSCTQCLRSILAPSHHNFSPAHVKFTFDQDPAFQS